ncbi:MAG: hypothetical protein P1V81_12625 [Planctomycetota bacterium]|nr:hypothetical protein [Planctomycetota bacterium]
MDRRQRPGWPIVLGLAALVAVALLLGRSLSSNRLVVANATGQTISLLRVTQVGSDMRDVPIELIHEVDLPQDGEVRVTYGGGFGEGLGLDAIAVTADGREIPGWTGFYVNDSGHRVRLTVGAGDRMAEQVSDRTPLVWLLWAGVLLCFFAAWRRGLRISRA